MEATNTKMNENVNVVNNANNVENKTSETTTKKATKKPTTKKASDTLKKAVATANANKFILDNLRAQFDTDFLIKGQKGQSIDLYRKEIFKDMLPEEKKTTRRKLRAMLQGFLLQYKNGYDLKKLYKNFLIFYQQVYAVNDFSVNSICGGKTDIETRNIAVKFMEAMKKQAGK